MKGNRRIVAIVTSLAVRISCSFLALPIHTYISVYSFNPNTYKEGKTWFEGLKLDRISKSFCIFVYLSYLSIYICKLSAETTIPNLVLHTETEVSTKKENPQRKLERERFLSLKISDPLLVSISFLFLSSHFVHILLNSIIC